MNFQPPFRRIFLVGMPAVLFAVAAGLSGCLSAPEHCHGCLAALADGGPVPTADATVGGTGGATGSGGIGLLGTGGLAGAGVEGTGGMGTGGRGTGGVTATGGAGTGGMGTGGGAGTGGRGTGGSASGGSASGGSGTGGVSATGGRASGGGGAGGGVSGSGGAAGSGLGGNGTDADLVLWYKFDESSGTMAADAAMSGGTARPAMLGTVGTGATAAFTTTRQVGSHAVSLTPSGTLPAANLGFVTVPTGLQTLAPGAMTISVWVNLRANTAAEAWERIFDFGSGKSALGNMYLTARAADAPGTPVRFAITNTGHATATAEQRIDGTAPLTTNAWHHIVVVLDAGSTFTGRLYIDNVAVGTNTMMTLHAADVGATTTNWLGRSQFSAADGTNPGLNGFIDDFRVYRRALSAAEVSALFALR